MLSLKPFSPLNRGIIKSICDGIEDRLPKELLKNRAAEVIEERGLKDNFEELNKVAND